MTGATAAGVVLASGAGTRVGGELNKVFLPLAGRRVVSWSVDALSQVPDVGVLMLVVRPQDQEHVRWVLDRELDHLSVEVVHGGATRQESELCALRALATRIGREEIDTVLIHDAARPLPSLELIVAVLGAAREHGGAIPGIPGEDLRSVDADGQPLTNVDLDQLVRVQTPQGFRALPLLQAYEQAAREDFVGTDTASCIERFTDLPIRWILGEQTNLKITYREDLSIAEQVLAGITPPRRVELPD